MLSNQFAHTLYTKHLLLWNHITNSIGNLATKSEDTFRFSDINVEIQGENEIVIEKFVFDGKEMRQNISDTENETEYASVEDSLNMHRTTSKNNSNI